MRSIASLSIWVSDGQDELDDADWQEVMGIVEEALSTSKFHATQFDINAEEKV